MPGFKEGDVVVRLRTGVSQAADATVESGTLGTICRIVTEERSYKVRYADFPFCVLVFQDSIKRAPAGSEGPECESDC